MKTSFYIFTITNTICNFENVIPAPVTRKKLLSRVRVSDGVREGEREGVRE